MKTKKYGSKRLDNFIQKWDNNYIDSNEFAGFDLDTSSIWRFIFKKKSYVWFFLMITEIIMLISNPRQDPDDTTYYQFGVKNLFNFFAKLTFNLESQIYLYSYPEYQNTNVVLLPYFLSSRWNTFLHLHSHYKILKAGILDLHIQDKIRNDPKLYSSMVWYKIIRMFSWILFHFTQLEYFLQHCNFMSNNS